MVTSGAASEPEPEPGPSAAAPDAEAVAGPAPDTVAKARFEYRMRLGAAIVAGLLSLVGWGWAIVLALVPVDEPVPGSGPAVACGSPALFDESAFAHSLGSDESFGKYWAGLCADTVSWHTRGAVGISVVTAPVAALWLWCAGTLARYRPAGSEPGEAGPGTP